MPKLPPPTPDDFFWWLYGDATWDGLRAATFFARAAKEHEFRHVLTARRDGWSWALIASVLHVRPQTAHKRWAKKVEETLAAQRARLDDDDDDDDEADEADHADDADDAHAIAD